MPRQKKPKEEHYKKFGISLTPEDYDRVIEYCNREERSISWVFRKALDLWFEQQGL